MRAILLTSIGLTALLAAAPARAQQSENTPPDDRSGRSDEARRTGIPVDEIVVTATRRAESIQDVPLSINAFDQRELSVKGVVGYEGLAAETPGVVLNKPSANFNNFTARGIAVNGYNANLQSTVAIYIDEVPISANGNSTIIDPNLFDVDRVEFLRGPQGTLFGSGSLAGAVRVLNKEPDLDESDASALVDIGLIDNESLRQRYNAMANIPLIEDKAALRVVGFARHEEGWVDNLGTGQEDANTLVNYGGRAILLAEPTENLSVRLLYSREKSNPKDSSLVSLDLGERARLSDEADRFTGDLTNYNATIVYDFDWATLTSSSTYTKFDQRFYVDLAGTFGQLIPFGLDADAYDDIFTEEIRLVSAGGGRWDWVVGGFYFDKRRDVDLNYRSSVPFLAERGLTGLDGEYYQRTFTYATTDELAAFGEVTYRVNDRLRLIGGLRYGTSEVRAFTEGGFNSNYLIAALTGATGPLTVTETDPVVGEKAEEDGLSYKASLAYELTPEINAYATFATGFRTPIRNAFAGRPSVVNADDIVIPDGADSDDLESYEIGLKGSWLDGAVSANLAAYYIDWSNIQVQANRVSDSVQFATNIGRAESKGLEFEVGLVPVENLRLGVNGSLNDAKVTALTDEEAAISGAVEGQRLASPKFQGAASLTYDFALGAAVDGFFTANVQHVGSFPGLFPNVPGQPGVQRPTFAYTDSWEKVNLSLGANRGDWTAILYVENLLDTDTITYVHPEAFLESRFGTHIPRTFGMRLSYGI